MNLVEERLMKFREKISCGCISKERRPIGQIEMKKDASTIQEKIDIL